MIELALQKSIYDTLMSDSAVQAIVAGRVYDSVPADVTFPFIQIGDDALSSELWMTEAFVSVQGITEGIGMPAVKALAGAIRVALDTQLNIPGFHVAEHEYQDTSFAPDTDNSSQMADMTFRYLIQELPTLP